MSQIDHSVATAGANGATTVEECYLAGLDALDQGELEQAENWAARCDAAPGGPGDVRCAMLRGAIAEETGDFDGAVEQYRRAADTAPRDATVVRLLGRALVANGDLTAALGVLEDAARNVPEDASLLVDLGYVRARSGDGPGSVEAARRAVALKNADGAVFRAAAQMYEAQGELEPAVEALAAVARETPAPQVLNDLGRLYLELERYNEADAVFRRLEQVDPEAELVARHGRIWCQICLGDWRGALDVALDTTRLDRYDLTTAFLAYAKDRLFGRVPGEEVAQREADLGARFNAELRDHYELHAGELLDAAEDYLEMGEGEDRG